jgi:hypothetical protein
MVASSMVIWSRPTMTRTQVGRATLRRWQPEGPSIVPAAMITSGASVVVWPHTGWPVGDRWFTCAFVPRSLMTRSARWPLSNLRRTCSPYWSMNRASRYVD